METNLQALGALSQSHPWHGVPIGKDAPNVVTAYIEIVPTDTVKYELDKMTGLLRVDRPQKYSNFCPSLYGLVPQTLCADQVADLSSKRTGHPGIVGDADPLDICVLTERSISHGNILVRAIPIGGMRMLDRDEADDKIVAVLEGDATYGHIREIADAPPVVIDRLRHYFLTYKQAPDALTPACEITHVYGREEATDVIERSRADYMARYAHLAAMLTGFIS
ncbi:MAG: inorganic pyrophosphatase [Vicinamibacteria bacterium]|nr:inorganic pyrophosphatase [Vicinamibacteria bacterium]